MILILLNPLYEYFHNFFICSTRFRFSLGQTLVFQLYSHQRMTYDDKKHTENANIRIFYLAKISWPLWIAGYKYHCACSDMLAGTLVKIKSFQHLLASLHLDVKSQGSHRRGSTAGVTFQFWMFIHLRHHLTLSMHNFFHDQSHSYQHYIATSGLFPQSFLK